MQTPIKTPTTIIPQTIPGTSWQDENNILLADGQFAVSGGSTQILTVGGFNLNLAQGDTINNIIFSVKGYRGNFNSTLQIFAVDDTSGVAVDYQLLPSFQGFNGVNTLWTLPNTLFGTVWTVNMLNNIKIKLISDGELHLDTTTLSAIYTPAATSSLNYNTLVGGPFQVGDVITGSTSFATAIVVTDNGSSLMTITNVSGIFITGETITGAPSGATATIVSPFLSGQTVCDEFVQAQRFQLAQSMTSASLFCLVNSFNYPDGVTPIQIADFHGNAMVTLDQGIEGSEENCRITNITHNWNGTTFTKLDFTALTNRGLGMMSPYTSVPANILDHNGTAELVISNNAPFYDRFVKKCQIGAGGLVSKPIEVDDEGVQLTIGVEKFNFIGPGVTATNSGNDVDIIIPGAGGTTPPVIVSTISISSYNIQVNTLTANLQISGLNRGVVIQVSTEEAQTITGITVGGVAATQQTVATDVVNNLRQETWYCTTPPLGAQPVIVTLSGNAYLTFGAECVNGVDPVTPIGATNSAIGTSANPTTALVTTVDYSVVIDGLCTGINPITYTAGVGQANNWVQTANTVTRQGASSVESAGLQPDAITMDWAITQNTNWAITAIELVGITVAVPGSGQTAIQFEDETGAPLGITGTVDEFEITGGGVAGTRVGNKVTYTLTDEKVKASAADTTPGYLDPKQNIHSSDGSITITKSITNPGANEVMDYDFTGAGGGSPSNPLDVTILDDFTTLHSSDTNTGGATWKTISTSGNFISGDDRPFVLIDSELNHPGIADVTGTNVDPYQAYGFTSGDGTADPSSPASLSFDNDFDIEILARGVYSTTGVGDELRMLFFIGQGATAIEISLIDNNGTKTVNYNIGGGNVPVAIAFPASNAWFKVRVASVGGTMTATVDGNLLYTGVPGFTGPALIKAGGYAVNAATLVHVVDYVLTNYQVTR